jgi:imidazolonepropionase-like amidohydrolase
MMLLRRFILFLGLSLSALSQPFVLTNGIIHTAKEEAFQGWVVVENGKIAQVGRGEPPGELARTPIGSSPGRVADPGQRVDLAGGHLYPGLIDADSQLGLVEIESLRATRDEVEVGNINPNLRAAVGFRAESVAIPVARSQGVLVTGVNPIGGLISGQGSVMRLWGWTWEDATVRPAWAMSVDWPAMSVPLSDDEAAQAKSLEGLGRELFRLVEAFQEGKAYQAGNGDVKWQALKPYADGQQPVLVRAEGKSEIEAALAWAEQAKVRLVLVCGREVHLLAEQLAQRNIPVIYSSLNSPSLRAEESASLYHRTPSILRKAGVLVALSPSGLAFDVRELRDLAGKAAGNGLTRLEALQSITLAPAKILGVEDRLGSIEAGKEATLVLASGDILETTPRVLRAWGAGVEIPLDDRQKELYQKYRSRPRKP